MNKKIKPVLAVAWCIAVLTMILAGLATGVNQFEKHLKKKLAGM